MSAEAKLWLAYAGENHQVAALALQHGLYNASVQNAQQSVEKVLKAVCLERGLGLKKTHSVDELLRILGAAGVNIPLTEDDAALFDTAYLPTKYPLSALTPDFSPDLEITRRCLVLAEQVLTAGRGIITD